MKLAQKVLAKHSLFIGRLFLCCIACIMMIAVLTGLTTVSNNVTIHEDGEVYSRYTIYTELDDILANENIVLGKDDKLEFTGFEDHQAEIYITRAFDVSVSADGVTQTVVMTDGTVQDVLDKAGITLSADDLLNVSTSEPVNAQTAIYVNRVTYTENQIVEEIPYQAAPEAELASNQKAVITIPGQTGEKVTTTRTKWIDGVEAETIVISEEITREPVNEQQEILEEIHIGGYKQEFSLDQVPIELDENGNPVNYSQKITGKATAYSALGRPTSLKPGDVAMNLSQFPKGTRLYIKTPDGGYVYGYSTVRDTGTAVNNGSVLVDCYFVTYEESVDFGAKTVDVYVLN